MRVAAFMSGGVDSAVAASLLVQQGHEVEGVFMKNWTPLDLQNPGDCPWQQDQDDAEASAKVIGIPFRSVNFEREYQHDVAEYFTAEYAAGRTPNPDMLCNQKIKFGAALAWAKKEGFAAVATGHYAQISTLKGQQLVARGRDKNKDQSYFLATVDPTVWAEVLFPLGGLTKPQVRRLAERLKLPVAKKKDSQGICFIGQLPVRQFLSRSIKTKKGQVLNPAGEVIGEHSGAALYTIGQRHGWRITQAGAVTKYWQTDKDELPALFVVGKDIRKNTITVDKANNPCLNRREFELEGLEWYRPAGWGLKVQLRYRSEAVPAKVIKRGKERLVISTKKAVWAVASGQFAVFYVRGVVVGCGRVV